MITKDDVQFTVKEYDEDVVIDASVVIKSKSVIDKTSYNEVIEELEKEALVKQMLNKVYGDLIIDVSTAINESIRVALALRMDRDDDTLIERLKELSKKMDSIGA